MDPTRPHDLRSTWPAARPAAQLRWTRLTEADLESIDGDVHRIGDCLSRRYGFSPAEFAQELQDFAREHGQEARPAGAAPASGAEGSFGLARSGESRGREVPGDRPGHPGDSSAEQTRAARQG